MILPILAVDDVEVSSAFYTQKLGMAELFRSPGEDGSYIFAMVSFGKGTMIGLDKQPGIANKGIGSVFMVYVPEETDIDTYYEEVKSRGVLIERELANEYWGDRTFAVKDPDGFYISLCKTMKQMSVDEVLAAQS